MKSGILREESGQGMVEYGLILALISVVSVAILASIGEGSVKKIYDKNSSSILEVLK